MYFKAAKTLSDVFEKRFEEIERECDALNPPPIDSMERCNLLLADMRANPLSEWFRDAVDHVALGLTDYPQVIAHPMDLGTVGKKMERSQYMSTEDFAHDTRLVWQNAITYNSAASMLVTMSSKVYAQALAPGRAGGRGGGVGGAGEAGGESGCGGA